MDKLKIAVGTTSEYKLGFMKEVLNEINIQASGGDAITVYTKPHSEYAGLAFLWDSKTKTSNQILSQKYGLTTPNPHITYSLTTPNIQFNNPKP